MSEVRNSQLIVTLRHNIEVEADVNLAVSEVAVLCGITESFVRRAATRAELCRIFAHADVPSEGARLLTHHLRQAGCVALVIDGPTLVQFERVLLSGAFGQDLLYSGAVGEAGELSHPMANKLSRKVQSNGSSTWIAISLSSVLDYSTRMVSHRGKSGSVSIALDALVEYLLYEQEPRGSMASAIASAIDAKRTSLYLTHELHLYKGKFFPRMVRSLINRYVTKPNSLIVDPFVGSGTALLDAALLGHRSIGFDVDPTSVLISQHKITPAELDTPMVLEACLRMHEAVYGQDSLLPGTHYSLHGWEKFLVEAPEPMKGRLAKRGREEGFDLLGEVQNDSAKALCLISQLPGSLQPLMRVCLSHALTKKLRLRFVGIGNGRFTIDVAKVGILDLFVKKAFHLVAITEAFDWLRSNGVTFPDTKVIRNSAKEFHRSFGQGNKIDLIITSPPYIPASSGREHYARARAIPLVFTGAATLAELDHLDDAFIGEMSAQLDTLHLEADMPPAVRSSLEFLRTNEQRNPKYIPTLNYYVDLKQVLGNVEASLAEDGHALFVVATSHTFYIHKTKEILHTVNAVQAIAELGMSVGLEVKEIITIPLQKSGGLNARPRSTDEYSESVVVFRKPSLTPPGLNAAIGKAAIPGSVPSLVENSGGAAILQR